MYNDNHLIPIKITDITAENNNSYFYFVKAINADNIGLISVKDDAMLNNLIRKKEISNFYAVTVKGKSSKEIGLLFKVNESAKYNSAYSDMHPSKIKVKYKIFGIAYTKSINLNDFYSN